MRCRPFLACLLLAACGTTTRIVPTNPSPHPLTPRPTASVQVFTTTAPTVPFIEVAIIQSQQSSNFSDDEMPEIIVAMREEAGKAGCDAVVIHGAHDKVEGGMGGGPGAYAGVHSLEGFWGACVVFTEAQPARAAGYPVQVSTPSKGHHGFSQP